MDRSSSTAGQTGEANKAQTKENMQQLDRKKELATSFQVSPRTIENFVQRGMPCIRPSSRLVLFDRAACLKWLTDSYSVAAKPSSYRARTTVVSAR